MPTTHQQQKMLLVCSVNRSVSRNTFRSFNYSQTNYRCVWVALMVLVCTCTFQLLSCISEHKQKGEILFPVKAVERLTTFFARTFVRNLKAFQLVCHELHRERTETRLLSVQTPLIPLPLRCSLEEAAAAAVSVHIAESHVSHE
jgi:hypothetical protein